MTERAVDGRHAAVRMHRLLRQEFAALPERVRGVAAGDVAHARVVAAQAGEMLGCLARHQRAEDEFLWPLLRPRLDPDAGLFERLQSRDHLIGRAADTVARLLPVWEQRADELVRADLAAVLDNLYTALVKHLDDEDAHAAPIADRTLTPEQWRTLRQALLG